MEDPYTQPNSSFSIPHHRVNLALKFGSRIADNPYMEKSANGSWYVKKKDEAIGIVGADSSVVAVLPKKKTGEDTRIAEAYLFAAAPQLFDVCRIIHSILENSLIVTPEGFKINCSDLKVSLSDAILRAKGYRKSPDEP